MVKQPLLPAQGYSKDRVVLNNDSSKQREFQGNLIIIDGDSYRSSSELIWPTVVYEKIVWIILVLRGRMVEHSRR